MSSGGTAPLTSEDAVRLSRLVAHLTEQLRQQGQILKLRGMNLPPGTIHGLESMQIDLEKVAPRMSEHHNELERLRALADTTALINSSLDLDQVLVSIVDTVVSLTRAERGYIMLRDPETDELQFRYARGMDQRDLDSDSLVVSKTIVQEVARTGEPIVTTNAQDDARFAGQHSIVGFNLRSILCAPLVSKGVVQGVVYADNSIQDALFSKKDLNLLVAIASQAALAIENARLFEEARQTLEEVTRIKNLLDNILASIASGVITTDARQLVTQYNLGAQNILRVPETVVIDQPFNAALPPIYEHVKDYLAQVSMQEEAVTIEAEETLDQRGPLSLNLKLSPLKDAENTTQGIALVVDDMTELKKRDNMLAAVRRYLPPVMVDNIQSIERIGLEGERRLVTVMFVEVRPFNSFDTTLQAGQLMQLLNLYLTVGTEAIHRRAGLIDKYMGSEIMGIFNSQLNPSEQHAWDAVQAGLEMTHDFQELYNQLGESPATPYYRIGIHTGIATLGNVGGTNRREFSAIGDTVNSAKRLQENAAPGQLIISQATYDLCADYLNNLREAVVQPGGALQVKGREQALHVYQLEFKRRV